MSAGTGGSAPSGAGLRLRAEDAEDVAIVSACLQDALVSVRDLAYDRDAGVFVMAANRFRWEGRGEPRAVPFERTLCAVTFEAVTGVVYRGFQRKEEERILSLLAIHLGERATVSLSGVSIDLEFAGEATIRLCAAAIRCRVRDFGEPWPTAWRPGHALDDQR